MSCTSDVLASLGPARVWFVSLSGYDGDRGSGKPMPEPYVEAMGINRWFIVLIDRDVALIMSGIAQ